MNAGIILADTGNIGLLVCAAIDTAAVAAYAIRAHGDAGKWWRTPFGLHLMCFMIAFAVVLDQGAIYLLTGPGVLVTSAPPGRPDWFAWERGISFAVLIPAVLAWRLYIILRLPRRDLGLRFLARDTPGPHALPGYGEHMVVGSLVVSPPGRHHVPLLQERALLLGVKLLVQVPLSLVGPLETEQPGEFSDGRGILGGPEPRAPVRAADHQVIERLDTLGDVRLGAIGSTGERAHVIHSRIVSPRSP